MSKTSSSSSAAKPLRIDGFEARNRLLDAALTLFAEKGFAKTSIREIAQASQVNIASISYYFGDKAGLYRAVFTDPRCNPNVPPESIADASIGLQQALQRLMWSFLDPLKQGHLMQHCMKLHFREMLEPTGIWQEEIDSNIKPAHAALVGVLCRHLGLAKADDDIHALAFSISGLGVMLHIGCDVVTSIRPKLVASHAALDRYCERLVAYAMALTEAEAQRRARPAAHPRSNRKPSQK
jgi:AcrR family transcriptional regulator